MKRPLAAQFCFCIATPGHTHKHKHTLLPASPYSRKRPRAGPCRLKYRYAAQSPVRAAIVPVTDPDPIEANFDRVRPSVLPCNTLTASGALPTCHAADPKSSVFPRSRDCTRRRSYGQVELPASAAQASDLERQLAAAWTTRAGRF